MKIIAEDASGGSSSAGGVASSMGNGTGFASGGIGMQKRKKKKYEEVEENSMTDAEKEGQGPKFTGYWKGTDKGRPGKKMVGGD